MCNPDGIYSMLVLECMGERRVNASVYVRPLLSRFLRGKRQTLQEIREEHAPRRVAALAFAARSLERAIAP